MKHNFDSEKSLLEMRLEKVASMLENTHPEQKSDAMADYAAALVELEKANDIIHITPIVAQLKRLYIYPNRQEHNEMLIALYDIKELLYETRIDKAIKKHQASKKKKQLGETKKNSKLPLIIISLIAIYFITR